MSKKRVSKTNVRDFLKSQFVMSIATFSDAKPQSSIVLYAIDYDFTMYFVTHRDSHKARALLKNNNISLSIWEHKQMLVQADGKVTELVDQKNISKVMDKIAVQASKDGSFWPPVLRFGDKEYIVFKITLQWMRALDLSNDSIVADESPFTDFTF